MNYHKENKEATKAAEQAREQAREAQAEALAYARQCRGESVEPLMRVLASSAGKNAAEARKAAKEAAAKASAARRLACAQAMPKPPVPPLPREFWNGGKMPVPPPMPKKENRE